MNPLLPLLAVGGVGLLAVLLGRRSSTPVPDPVDVARILLAGAAGERQYEMRRVGPGFGWVVRGAKEGSGSDTNSGLSIVTMFEFLYMGNSADNISGFVADSDGTQRGSFSVVRETATRWAWLVSKPSPDQAASLGSGDSTSRGAATLAALKVIEPFTDWIVNLPSPVGGTGPGEPTGDPVNPDSDGDVPLGGVHGLAFGTNTVAVYSLPVWLDYAAPIVRDGIAAGSSATEIHEALGLHDLPNTTKFSGKSHGQVLNTMLAYLNQWDAQKFLEIESIQRVVAAAAVGATIPAKTGERKGLVKNKPVVVKRSDSGVYEWYVWPVGNRRSVEYAMFEGSEYRSMPAWNKAVTAASGPGTVSGGGAPVQNCDTTVNAGVPLNMRTFSQNAPSRNYKESWTKDFIVWSPNAALECREFVVDVGLCMIPSGGGSFGALDFYTEGLSEGDEPSKGDADDIEFGISRHPAYNAAMDWWRFETPLAWKRQVRVRLSLVDGELGIDGADYGDYDVDACPEVDGRWPGSGDDHYVVQGWKTAAPRDELIVANWRGRPELEFVIENKKLVARMKFTGLPKFESGTSANLFKTHGALPNAKNSYTVGFKIRSKGVT